MKVQNNFQFIVILKTSYQSVKNGLILPYKKWKLFGLTILVLFILVFVILLITGASISVDNLLSKDLRISVDERFKAKMLIALFIALFTCSLSSIWIFYIFNLLIQLVFAISNIFFQLFFFPQPRWFNKLLPIQSLLFSKKYETKTIIFTVPFIIYCIVVIFLNDFDLNKVIIVQFSFVILVYTSIIFPLFKYWIYRVVINENSKDFYRAFFSKYALRQIIISISAASMFLILARYWLMSHTLYAITNIYQKTCDFFKPWLIEAANASAKAQGFELSKTNSFYEYRIGELENLFNVESFYAIMGLGLESKIVNNLVRLIVFIFIYDYFWTVIFKCFIHKKIPSGLKRGLKKGFQVTIGTALILLILQYATELSLSKMISYIDILFIYSFVISIILSAFDSDDKFEGMTEIERSD